MPRSPRRRTRVPGETRLRQRLRARLRVAVQHPVRVDAGEAEGDEPCARLEAQARDACSLAISTAAAPSQICDELPAVTLPSGRNAGSSAASASGTCRAAASRRRRSARRRAGSSPRRGRSRSRSGPRRSPPARRGATRASTRRVARATAPLLRDHLGRDSLPNDLPLVEQLRDRSPPFDPIGTRDIISTPAETTTSSWPDQTAAAALKFACIDEPH